MAQSTSLPKLIVYFDICKDTALRALLFFILIATGLGGCAYGVDKRFGLDPVIDPASVETSAQNQGRILTALATDAGIVPGAPATWYAVAEAGFNYVDDQCNDYFKQIFFINRDRERVKSGLGAGSAATAAILGVTGASSATLAIAAQAFGLGIAGTDFGTSEYLYQLPPSTTQGFVKEMQLAYREGIAERRTLIDSGPAAYHAVQEYLSLCLPPTIEAKLAEHIASARATPDPVRLARTTAFSINLSTPPPLSRQEIRQAIGEDFSTIPPATGSASVRPSRPSLLASRDFTSPGTEPRPASPDLLAYKRALCVRGPEAETGEIGSETQDRIQEFRAGSESKPVADASNKLTAEALTALKKATRQFPSCNDPVKNAYEVGVYSRYGADEVSKILHAALEKNNLPADAISDRIAMGELRKAYGQAGPPELDGDLWLRARDDGQAAIPSLTGFPSVPRR